MANLTPQAKRLIILGLLGIVLVGGALVVNTYLLAPGPPPPPPPVRPVLPPPQRPPAVTPPPTPAAPAAPAPRPQAAVPSPGLEPRTTPPPVAPPPPPPPPPPPKLAMAAPVPGSYGLQVGAFAVKSNAERLQKRLEEKGYAATLRQASPRLPRHRVLVGEYAAQADAQAQRKRVLGAGATGAKVVPAGGGKFTVEAGTFQNLDAAIDLARELQKSGIVSRIDSRPTATGLYQVRIGAYASKQEAQTQLEALRKEGLSPIVVRN